MDSLLIYLLSGLTLTLFISIFSRVIENERVSPKDVWIYPFIIILWPIAILIIISHALVNSNIYKNIGHAFSRISIALTSDL